MEQITQRKRGSLSLPRPLIPQPSRCTHLILSIFNEHLQTQQNTFVHGHRASELGLHVRTAPYKPCRLEIGGTAKDPAVACMPSILAITKQRGSIALISRLEYCRSGKACTWQQTGKLVPGVSERRRLDTCGERDRTRSSRCSILQARRNCTRQPWRRPAAPTTACRLCRLRKVLMLGFT